MNFLPKDLEDIIVDYKTQMEHLEKFHTSLDKINEIEYIINQRYTWRTHDNVTTQYHEVEINLDDDDYYNSHKELWVHRYFDIDDDDTSEEEEEEEDIQIIFEDFSDLHLHTIEIVRQC